MLLVGEDDRTGQALATAVARAGVRLETVRTGAEAITRHTEADLIAINLELPDLDGTEVCRRIRSTSAVPLLCLIAAESTELERILSLRAGADMCLTRPVGVAELAARIEVVTRRLQPRPVTSELLRYGGLEIDVAAREVRVAGRSVDMTRKEFDLLYLLASRRGSIVNRKQILSVVWDDENAWMQRSRTIDTHVNSIRRKIGKYGAIRTRRGVGFQFCHSDNGIAHLAPWPPARQDASSASLGVPIRTP
jgi:DNA-binding response OmpR family regulator